MAQGVQMASEETGQTNVRGRVLPVRMSRTWRSPEAEVEFRDKGNGQVEPASMRGEGGVVVTATDLRGDAAPAQSKLAADVVTGTFGPDSGLSSMTGTGHARMEQTSATGTHQTATGDRLEVYFAQPGGGAKPGAETAQVQSAMLDGHVTLAEQPAPKTGEQRQPQMRATAEHAVYDSVGEWLHLTGSPRVVDGGLEMTADKIDLNQASGDAMARGDVKATWANTDGQTGAKQTGMTLGAQGPAHAVADEAQVKQAQGQAVFTGNARLWQDKNSVAAPTIAIDRQKQALTAQTQDRADPVRVVLVSQAKARGSAAITPVVPNMGQPSGPAVIRVRGGELWYSDAERKAVMHGGVFQTVTAATATATTVSENVELELTAAGKETQVERMTATGRVVVSSEGRRGTGERLVYTEADGNSVLTGTPGEPPKLTDPARGSVTGAALIFHSGDDSVSIEGGPEQTQTVTTAPK